MSEKWHVVLYIKIVLFIVRSTNFSMWVARVIVWATQYILGLEDALKVTTALVNEPIRFYSRRLVKVIQSEMRLYNSLIKYREIRHLTPEDVAFIKSIRARLEKTVDFLLSEREFDMWSENAEADAAIRASREFTEWYKKRLLP